MTAKLFTMVPFRADANLGAAYNEAMALLPADAWAVFLDHDAMPTTGKWNAQFSEAIAFRPDAGAFVAMTNRIASPWQKVGVPQDLMDMVAHRRIGAERLKVRTLLDISETKGFGGVMFAISKSAWAEAGGFADGLGCVDHSIHFALQKIGRPVYLIEGLYVFHWRHYGEPDPTSQFPKAAGCPCRGPEVAPTVRIALP
jgi:hypothetical protein